MSEFHVRDIFWADRDAVLAVQRQTLLAGEPLRFPVQDLDALLAYFLDYYLLVEPEAATVVEDADGRVAGYLVGSVDPEAAGRWQRRRAAALGWLWATRWHRYDPFTRWFYRLRIADAWEVIRDPGPPLEAHCHYNVLPSVRGHALWALLRRFRDHVVANGKESFGGDHVLIEGTRNRALSRRLGFHVVHEAPHHTLTGLLGRPVRRVTVNGRWDELRL